MTSCTVPAALISACTFSQLGKGQKGFEVVEMTVLISSVDFVGLN